MQSRINTWRRERLLSISSVMKAAGMAVPRSRVWSVVFNLISTAVTSILPRGDYAKARRALRGN